MSKVVYLLRHGESEQNVSGGDEPDTVLTARGVAQEPVQPPRHCERRVVQLVAQLPRLPGSPG